MNAEQKKLLKDRLIEIEYSPRRVSRHRSDNDPREPRHIKLIRKRIAKGEKMLRKYSGQQQKEFDKQWRPVVRAVESARKEIYFGDDVKKALAFTVRAETLAKKILR